MRERNLARLEAVLFVARGSLNSRKLAEFAGLADGTQARTLVRRLNELYEREGSAFRVEDVAGGFQLMTRPCFGPWLRRLHTGPVEVRLSTPAMETLAVIAHRQPVQRSELEAIRGVQCGEMLRQLNERDLVRIVGRSQELGRPFLYGTTRKFLQVFGLRSLDELPRPALRSPAPAFEIASTSSQESIDSLEESQVKIAIFPQSAAEEPLSPLAPEFIGDKAPVAPRADAEMEEDEGDEAGEEDEEDEELEDEEYEDEEWEEVEDDDEDDWDEEDEDWDEDEDEDEDWGDDEEE